MGRALTIRQGVAQLQRLSASIEGDLRDALVVVADAAIPRLRDLAPVDTGELRDSWTTQGTALVNTADYASFVVSDADVQGVLDDLENSWESDIDRRIRSVVRS